MYLVALTGSIGSGKTTTAEIFRSLGAAIVDADELAREAVLPGTTALKKIAEEFGNSILNSDGTLNRKAMGRLVFDDKAKRKNLEAILHPEIRRLFTERVKTLAALGHPSKVPVIYVVPLLFEARLDLNAFDFIVVVAAPRELCLARIQARDNCSLELAERKYSSQIPIEEKKKKADCVIENNSSLEALTAQCSSLYAELVRRAAAEASKGCA